MGTGQRILSGMVWALLVASLLGVVAGGMLMPRGGSAVASNTPGVTHAGMAEGGEKLPVLYDAPAFSLTDQNHRKIARDDLLGQPWVAAFIFTHCAGPCPMMTSKMRRLQDELPDKSVRLVSFTVDPLRDTPAVLKEYANRAGADESRWRFLTGTPEEMASVAAGMKLAVATGGDASHAVFHSDRFLLVDASGRVRAAYHGNEPETTTRLTDALAILRSERPDASPAGKGERP